MPKGFDTEENCGSKAAQIRAAGYDFVVRYLGQSHGKRISPGEANQLATGGVAVALVYEDAPVSADYFNNARGQVDGTRAAQQASALNAPDGTTIYFAVDYDASFADVNGDVRKYFEGVNSALTSFAASGNPRYRVGVYGSGLTCSGITGAGLASQGWLAQATGWRGHGAYTSWSMSQGMPTTACGMSVDPDTAVGDYGAILPTPAIAQAMPAPSIV